MREATPPFQISWSTSSRILRAVSISPYSTVSGGRSLTVLFPAGTTSSPFSKHFIATFLFSTPEN